MLFVMEWRLGTVFPEHVILLWSEELAPLFIGMADLVDHGIGIKSRSSHYNNLPKNHYISFVGLISSIIFFQNPPFYFMGYKNG